MDMRATAPDGHGILKIPNPVQSSYAEPPDLSKTLGGEMYKVGDDDDFIDNYTY